MRFTFRVEEVPPVTRDARASSRFDGIGGPISGAVP
jgi:hypothetical protein